MVGAIDGENASGTVTNCYYLDTAPKGIGVGDGEAILKTAGQFASGEVAWLLQGGQKDQEPLAWGQMLSGEAADKLPVLTAQASEGVHQVTFAVNGEPDDPNNGHLYVNHGGTLPEAETMKPEREGFSFVKWALTNAPDGAAFTATTPVYSDLLLYPIFAEKAAEPEKGTGSLTVKVTVSGEGADKDKEWHFRVELDDKDIGGQYGEMIFIKGAAEFALKHGQSATAKGLPEGVGYTVTEAEKNRDGYTTAYSGEKGSILKDRELTADFVNEKTAAAAAGAAKTGDGSRATLWMQLTALSLAGMAAALLPFRGRKKPAAVNGRQVKR